jgi:16S rRNA C967 or C1407 C5-methylase (RsmB/RsmF family)
MPLPDFTPSGAPADADPEREQWRIVSVPQAEWAMRKLVRHTERLAEARRQHAEWQQQIDDWFADATAGDKREADWATGVLTAWAVDQREADPTAKTLHLPSGKVASRWVPSHPDVRDPGAVAEALARAEHPAYDDVVRAEVRIDATKLRAITEVVDGKVQAQAADGSMVVVPGVAVVPARLSITVTPKAAE